MTMHVRQGQVIPAEGIGSSIGGPDGATSPARTEREQTMQEYGTGFDGLRYDFHGYRYDRLADAPTYTHGCCARVRCPTTLRSHARGAAFVGPSEGDPKSMAAPGSMYEAGA